MPRPRKHPEGATPASRVAASQARRIASGSRRENFLLSPRAAESLDLIKAATGAPSKHAVIERLLEEERARALLKR